MGSGLGTTDCLPRAPKRRQTSFRRYLEPARLIELFEFFPVPMSAVAETGEFLAPGQLNVTHRTVAVFGDNQLGFTCMFGTFLLRLCLQFGTMNEHHDIGILLDGARFAQVAQFRARSASLFRLAV